MISDKQANEIAEFFISNSGKVKCFICQCEHGQSRSAAIAAALLEFRYQRGISVFADDRYYPNKYVFRKVYKALKEVKHNG